MAVPPTREIDVSKPSQTAAIFATVERVLNDHQTGLWSLDKIMDEVCQQTALPIPDDELLEMIIEVRTAQATAALFSGDDATDNSNRTHASSLD